MDQPSATHCSYRNCSTTKLSYPKVQLFSFPLTDPVIFKNWAINSGNSAFLKLSVRELQNKMLCEKHFEKKYFLSNNLCDVAVPNHYLTQKDSSDSSSDDLSDKFNFKCDYLDCGKSLETYPGLSFYKFPVADVARCKEWIVNCGNIKLAKLSQEELSLKRLCNLHFDENYFTKFKLRLDAVPVRYKYEMKIEEEVQDFDYDVNMEIKEEPKEFEEGLMPPIDWEQEIESQKDYRVFIVPAKIIPMQKSPVHVKEEMDCGDSLGNVDLDIVKEEIKLEPGYYKAASTYNKKIRKRKEHKRKIKSIFLNEMQIKQYEELIRLNLKCIKKLKCKVGYYTKLIKQIEMQQK